MAVIYKKIILKFYIANDEEKIKFAFKIYDINNDGYISNGELFKVIFSYNAIHIKCKGFKDDGRK